jgi:hypothetical protein
MVDARSEFKEVTGASIGWAVMMILRGLLAVVLPLASGVAGVRAASGISQRIRACRRDA